MSESASFLRWQPPVHSPLSARALFRGLAVALLDSGSERPALIRSLAKRYEADDALLTDSGTSALALALGRNVEGHVGPIALPAYGCFDLATAADGAGAQVLLYDVDPSSLGPDLSSLEGALRRGVSKVVVAPLYGIPVDLDTVGQLAREHGAEVLEDAAQGSGTSWRGSPVGAHGDASVLSFGRGKGWTGGGGGALLLRGEEATGRRERLTSELRPARRGLGALLGLAGQWLLARPSVYGLPASIPVLGLGETVYRSPRPPARMANVCAAVALETARLQGREIGVRRRHAQSLRHALPETLRAVRPPGGGTAGWLRLPALASSAGTAASARGEAGRRLGIAGGYPRPLHRLPGFADRCLYADDRFPGALELSRRLITLPTHSLLSQDDIGRLRTFLQGLGHS